MVKIQVNSQGKAYYTSSGKVLLAPEGGSTPTGTGKYLVQVIDYDGTVLKYDHLDEGDSFTLPQAPSHTKLVFEEWSSPVTITNDTITVPNSDVTIGVVYHTASGLSEFDITLTAVTGLSVTFNMTGTKDWGDGTTDTSTSHTYASAGNYTITCDGTNLESNIFDNYYVLTNVRLSENVTLIGDMAFAGCYSLTSITIPNGVTSIGSYAFYNCYSLTSITIPNVVTSIGSNAFESCYSLTSITIPNGVTSIYSLAFRSCYSISEYNFSQHTAVPTLSNTNTFDKINQICKIKVPLALESEWKAATNWSMYADYIEGI